MTRSPTSSTTTCGRSSSRSPPARRRSSAASSPSASSACPDRDGDARARDERAMSESQVLAGVRVLDYGRFIAAPWCSALLADMGADVIRVEKREGGEDRWVQSVTDGGEGGTFLQCNRNKRSLTLDSTTEEGAEITRQLVAGADVVIANMPASAMEVSGLSYEQLRAVRPDIILASATAYGEGGPDSGKVGFDGTGQVLSGATYRQGLPDQPIRTVVPYADFGTALTL